MFAIKTESGLFFKGVNFHGATIYGTDITEAKQFATKNEAHAVNDDCIGGTIVSVPIWAWTF